MAAGLNQRDMRILGVLKVYGPQANADVARRIGDTPPRTYRVLYTMVRSGQVAHERRRFYRITELGEESLARRDRNIPGLVTGWQRHTG